MTKIHMVKQTTRELIWYTAKYLFNAKEDNNEGIEKEKDIGNIPNTEMTELSSFLSEFNVNELNSPIKKPPGYYSYRTLKWCLTVPQKIEQNYHVTQQLLS